MRRLGFLLFALAACALTAPAFAAGAPVVVVVTAKGCEPAEVTVREGEVTFQIVNKSSRAMEWEILSGVMVVDERENIAPGFKQRMVTELKPGEYAMTCGLLSNPQGRLIVSASGAVNVPVRPSATDLLGPTAEYRFFLVSESEALVRAADGLAAALGSGDQAKAAEALAAAQSHFYRLRPALSPADAALTADLARLTAPSDTASDRQQSVQQLAEAAKALKARLMATPVTPRVMVSGAAPALTEAAGSTHASPKRKGAVEGVRKIVTLVEPLLARADEGLGKQLKADFQAIDQAGGGSDAEAANAALKTLTADAAKLAPALGLD